jgi:hypothetical protein
MKLQIKLLSFQSVLLYFVFALITSSCGGGGGGTTDSGGGGEENGGDAGAPDSCQGLPWRLVLGTSGPDTSWAVATAKNGDVLFAATEGQSLATDIVLRRLSPDGKVLWEGRWDSGLSDEAFVVTEASDGVIWIGGMRRTGNVFDLNTTAVLLRFDGATGAVIGNAWTWDSGGWDEIDGVAVDGGKVFVSGWGQGQSGSRELRVYALDTANLSILWQNSLDSDSGGLDAGNGHLVLWNDVVIVGGSWNSGGILAQAQGVVAAFNRSDGSVKWVTYVGDQSDYREILGLASDGSRVFAVGWRKVTLTDWQLMLWAFDSSGSILWESEWGGSSSERARSLAYDPTDNTLLVAGTTNRNSNDDIVLLRVDAATGAVREEQVWGGLSDDSSKQIAVSGNRLYVSGSTRSWGNGNSDAIAIGVCHRPWKLPSTN